MTLLCAALGAAPVLWIFAPSGWQLWPGGKIQAWTLGLEFLLLLWSVLAWRLNQARLALVSAGLWASLAWTVMDNLSPVPGRLAVADAWMLCVPLGLGLSQWPPQGRLLSWRSALSLGLMALPALLLWAGLYADGAELRRVLGLRIPHLDWPHQPSQLALLPALAGLALLWWWRTPKTEEVMLALAGSLGGQLLLGWMLHLGQAAPARAADAWLLSHWLQALALCLALYHLYWQRVYLDELSGIPNRRALDERLALLDGPFSIAMVDIDHFKRFNDDYGHDQGDDVLRLVARHLADGSGDRAYRYGGEEFCVLFEGLDSEAAHAEMDALRAALERRRFHIRLQKSPRKSGSPKTRGQGSRTVQAQVTVSVGVAQKDKRHGSPAAVFKLADQGVYKAKGAGRNNVQTMN